MTTLRQMGAKIGSRVRFIEDPDGQWRTVKTDAELDYKHLLPWVVENRTMSDDLVKRLRDGCLCNIDSTPCMAEEECRDAYTAADRIEELQAKLAKALVAVNYFFLRDPDKPTHWEYSRNRAEELARTAIAELEGERDG